MIAFDLPEALEATRPPETRDGVRLLVSGAEGLAHAGFRDLPRFLKPGDLLVVNDSATLPAAVDLPEGALHFSTRLAPGRWVVERRGPDLEPRLALPGGATLTRRGSYRGSSRLRVADLAVADDLAWLHAHGRPIRYPYVEGEWPLEEYQTIFARRPGSAEMPSAGRPFTPYVMARLALRGVRTAALTLHTGVASLESPEPPYPEWFEVPPATAEAVNRAERVIAVGTTVVRALESAVRDGRAVPRSGWTERVVTPDDPPLLVDGLLTGFHEPRASHLAMLEALAGREALAAAYAAAVEGGYRWHEFGDVHLLLGGRPPAEG